MEHQGGNTGKVSYCTVTAKCKRIRNTTSVLALLVIVHTNFKSLLAVQLTEPRIGMRGDVEKKTKDMT